MTRDSSIAAEAIVQALKCAALRFYYLAIGDAGDAALAFESAGIWAPPLTEAAPGLAMVEQQQLALDAATVATRPIQIDCASSLRVLPDAVSLG